MFDFESVALIGPMGSQAFWIWLTLGILILGVEVFLGTQWLLWSAAAAGVVAVICLTGLPFGFVLQVTTFAALSLIMALLTRRLLRVPQAVTDINEPHARLLGKQAEVLSGFDVATGSERTGRVVFDGVEWPAVLRDGSGSLKAFDRVVIEQVADGRLLVTPIV